MSGTLAKRLITSTLAAALFAGAPGWYFRERIAAAWNDLVVPLQPASVARPQPDARRYAELKEEAERWRKDLAARHASARTAAEKDRVLEETRKFLELLLPQMMRCWLGTGWDFNGTSETPGEGRIACGYFVATVMRDAGFRVDRYKLARQPSQNILRSFIPRESMTLRVGMPYESYAAEIDAADPGIRIVGLDSHVAFLVTGPGGFRFIHSSGSEPWCVVDESSAEAEVLRRSNYRVQGLLTADRALLLRWLRGEKIPVRESPAGTDRRAAAD
jgi:hypothetical protein